MKITLNKYLTDRYFWTGFSFFILLYLFVLPGRIIMISDDFGYYDSVARTIREGMIVTGDWLEPTNAFLSLCSWGVYKITHNFYLATMGILALCSIVNFIFLFILFNRKLPSLYAMILAILCCSFPTYFVRSVDFFNTIPSLTLFITALFLSERERWISFFVVLICAYSVRQSAIVLLAVPIFYYIREFHRVNWKIIGGSLFFILAIIFQQQIIPPSYAQVHLTSISGIFSHFDTFYFLNCFLTGIFGLTIIIGLLSFFTGQSIILNIRTNINGFFLPGLLTGLLTATYFLDQSYPVRIILNTLGLKWIGQLPWLFYFSAFIAVWIVDYSGINWRKPYRLSPYLASALAYIILVSLKGKWGDTYFFEMFLLGMFYIVSMEDRMNLDLIRNSKILQFVAASLMVCHVLYAGFLKIYLEIKEETILCYETLLREKKINISDASSAPFGYLGWKLFSYYTKNEGSEFKELSMFLNYVGSERSYLVFEPAWLNRFQSKNATSEMLREYQQLCCNNMKSGLLKGTVRVYLTSRPANETSLVPGAVRYPLAENYVQPWYPLDNPEWNRYLDY